VPLYLFPAGVRCCVSSLRFCILSGPRNPYLTPVFAARTSKDHVPEWT